MNCNKPHLTLRTTQGYNTPGCVSTLKVSTNSSMIRKLFYLDTVAAGAETRCRIVRASDFSNPLSKNLTLTVG